jgi:predicted PurR-regulated permease PerM
MLYIIFLLGIISFFIYGLPKIYSEATRFTAQLPQTLNNLEGLLDNITQDNPNLAQPIERIK